MNEGEQCHSPDDGNQDDDRALMAGAVSCSILLDVVTFVSSFVIATDKPQTDFPFAVLRVVEVIPRQFFFGVQFPNR
jgi:hypothetical protein